MDGERVQARVFGEVADEYDRTRPHYPAAMVDDVLAYSELDGGRALEVGAGTGKATEAFVARGVPVTAVEPDEAMAAVLARRLAGRPGTAIVLSSFEDYTPHERFGLLYSGQAWHWIDPERRWRRAAEALAPGGTLALFWNNDRIADPTVVTAMAATHQEHTPEITFGRDPVREEELDTDWPEFAALADFGDKVRRVYRWTWTMSSADFRTYLSTISRYRLLEESRRERLLEALADVLGDEVTLAVDTGLYLARRLP
jgi:SAM-dependent methyltransferase